MAIKKTVNISLKGLNALKKDMPKLVSTLEKEIALKAPSEIVNNIHAGKTGIFPASNLPNNAPNTIKRKGHSNQLIDKGILTTIGKWSIVKNVKGYLVRPPKNRGAVVGHLNEQSGNRPAYKILDIPRGFFPDWAAKLKTVFFNKQIPKYN